MAFDNKLLLVKLLMIGFGITFYNLRLNHIKSVVRLGWCITSLLFIIKYILNVKFYADQVKIYRFF